jgi:formylglycine-generating enzyme required for sulfatase activity
MTMSTRPGLAGEADPLVDTQPAASDSPPGPGMVWVPGGTFLMGSDHHYPEEAPAHPVTVDGFWIDRHPVTNAAFARFVRKTGHVTVAEQAPDPAEYPGARPELLVPASMVFCAPARRVDLADHYQWWAYVPGADWRHPPGAGQLDQKETRPPGGPGRLGRCGRLRRLGRQAAADRGRVGAGLSWWAGGGRVRLG